MQQTNIEFTTIFGGHQITLKPFVTGREKQSIGDVFMDTQAQQGIAPSQPMRLATRRALEITVVSVDGKAENIADAVLDLPYQDTTEIITRVNEITDGKKKESSM